MESIRKRLEQDLRVALGRLRQMGGAVAVEEVPGAIGDNSPFADEVDEILFAADLPKTRSGKIMRRLLRDIGEKRTLGDTTTLADPSVVQMLQKEYEEKE